MTIVATPDALAAPPSVDVTVSVPAGSVTSSLAVYRNDSAGRSELRTQPAAGFDSRTVTDIECPYGEPVTYDWVATYTDPTAYSTVFDELWASTAAWTVDLGTWNVSGGKVRNTTTGGQLRLRRTVTPGRYRITIASMSTVVASEICSFQLCGGSTAGARPLVELICRNGKIEVYYTNSLGVVSTITLDAGIDESQPITIDMGVSSFTISGTGGSVFVPVGFDLASIQLFAWLAASANNIRFGEVKVQSYPVPTDLAQTSAPVTLDPEDAWLVHPASPSLSVPMTNTVTLKAGIRGIGEVGNPTNATKHAILGSKTKITTTTGPRGDDETSMTIWTYTEVEAAALKALLADDIPILIQVPPDWEFDFACGYYAVGDTGAARELEDLYQGVRSREWRLPLTKTVSPVVDVENTGWSWAALAVEFGSWTSEKVTFASWADLAANNRS